MIAIKKIAAIFLAVSVVASSIAIFAGVGPAVELLASFEKEYENQKMDTEMVERLDRGIDKAEMDNLKIAKRLDGKARN